MAKFEGKGTGTTGASSYSLRLEVEETSYSVANNTSSVSWKLYLISTTYNFSSWSFTIKASVDGEVYNKNESRSISKNTTLLIGSGSKTITHNSDGTKKISCSASVSATGASYLPGNISVSGTLNLTNIPRTSKVSLSSTNFNIGTSITINTNRASSSFTHTAAIKFNGSTVRTQKSIGASYKWDTSELYDYIPKANKATGTITLTTYSGSTEIGSSSVSFTANVTNSNPTFSNCTYEDVGSVSTQLTGNNQVLINSCNSLKITISTANKAVAKNGATMSKYRLVCGSKSIEASYSSSADVSLTLDNVTSMTFIVYAIDSRGNSTAVTKSVEIWKDYSDIKIKTGSATRTGGVGTETTLTFEGELWNDSFGAETNEIVTCQYKYKKSNESTYGDPIDIIPTILGNNFSFSSTIKGDAEAEGFNLSNSFNIQVIVTDKIKTATYNILLGAGTPAMAIHPNGVAFAGPYDENESGIMQFPANQYFPERPAINLRNSDIVNANSIWMGDESTGNEGINFLKQGGDPTNGDDYETLRGYRGHLYYNDKRLTGYLSTTIYEGTCNVGDTVNVTESINEFKFLLVRRGTTVSYVLLPVTSAGNTLRGLGCYTNGSTTELLPTRATKSTDGMQFTLNSVSYILFKGSTVQSDSTTYNTVTAIYGVR